MGKGRVLKWPSRSRPTLALQAPKFKQNLAGLGERFQGAMVRAAHRAAQMMEEKGRADIASAGNFGGLWVSGLKARVEGEGQKNMRISMTHDDPRAGIFEKGGVVKGNPLLWIPLAGPMLSAFGRETTAGSTPSTTRDRSAPFCSRSRTSSRNTSASRR
jgi:hypothetical protein